MRIGIISPIVPGSDDAPVAEPVQPVPCAEADMARSSASRTTRWTGPAAALIRWSGSSSGPEGGRCRSRRSRYAREAFPWPHELADPECGHGISSSSVSAARLRWPARCQNNRVAQPTFQRMPRAARATMRPPDGSADRSLEAATRSCLRSRAGAAGARGRLLGDPEQAALGALGPGRGQSREDFPQESG